ncbi:hypothetical protein CLAIMM_08653 [Cladophialophora immunda]|nr:hypothetical protein CLAIMM_08653 [Cladophialophora immunda]
MRAQPAESKWANVDVSYTSALWEEHVVASEVFILPTVVSGQGTRQLLSIIDQAIDELSVQARELAHQAKTADHEQIAVKCATIHGHHRKQQPQSSDLKELSAKIHALRVIEDFELYAALVQRAAGVAEHLVGKFEQLQKVAQGVLTEQEEKGNELTQTPEGVKKLTVSIKCVDTIWADIISSWTKLKKLRKEIQEEKVALPPVRQHLKAIGANAEDDGGEAAEGDDQEDSVFDGATTDSHATTLEDVPKEEQGESEMP